MINSHFIKIRMQIPINKTVIIIYNYTVLFSFLLNFLYPYFLSFLTKELKECFSSAFPIFHCLFYLFCPLFIYLISFFVSKIWTQNFLFSVFFTLNSAILSKYFSLILMSFYTIMSFFLWKVINSYFWFLVFPKFLSKFKIYFYLQNCKIYLFGSMFVFISYPVVSWERYLNKYPYWIGLVGL